METILVTGGAGFIGSGFVRRALSTTPHRIVVLDLLTYAGREENLADLEAGERYAFERGDIADRETVAGVFQRWRPRWVVNFAAESHVDRSIDDASAFIRTNIAGAFEMLQGARHFWDSLEGAERDAFRFLHVSTDEVYGSLGEEGLFLETTPYAPNSPYAASKAGADHLVRAFHKTYGLPTLLTNCSNNYGPRQFPEKLIPLMVLNALEGKDLPIYGDGSNVRDWIYVEDHCDGILTALQKGQPGERYNFGGNAERSNMEVVDRICEALETERPAAGNAALRERGVAAYKDLKTFVQDRPGHDWRYAIDAGKADRELGWRPRHTFEEGLLQTVRWYLENRVWCRQVQEDNYDRGRLGLAGGGKAAQG
jgi:dTDP-glucose 4,6-dehydratase